MLFHSQSILLFISAITGVQSFVGQNTNSFVANISPSISSVKLFEQIPQTRRLVLLNLLSEPVSDTPTESEEENLSPELTEEAALEETPEQKESKEEKKVSGKEEEDITKIAYVVNLSYETPGYKIRELFNEYGTVTKVFIPKARATGKNKGLAFVTMTSEEERDLTIEKLNGIEIDGRKVYVDKAKSKEEKNEQRREDENNKKLYVGNIPYETSREELIEFFEQYGAVKDVYIPFDKETQLPRGFAFVTMTPEDADNAIENATGVELLGRTLDVKQSLPRGQKAPVFERKSAGLKIYIGNLSFDTEEDTLREIFSEFGPLDDLYLPIDQYTGRPRGFAFVTMAPDDASNAIEATDGLELDGRILRVNEAQPKGFKPPRDDGDWNEDDGGDLI
mmetsp:Transcript_16952/g.20700  ORF Transcript_16952/g.20700 Transcript_16952/m.20700 type:complete len:393 (-) Transcript_16952:205-1383(-)